MSLLSSVRQFSSDGEKLLLSNSRNSSYLALITFPEKLINKGKWSKKLFLLLFFAKKKSSVLCNLLEIVAKLDKYCPVRLIKILVT